MSDLLDGATAFGNAVDKFSGAVNQIARKQVISDLQSGRVKNLEFHRERSTRTVGVRDGYAVKEPERVQRITVTYELEDHE